MIQKSSMMARPYEIDLWTYAKSIAVLPKKNKAEDF